MSEGSIGMPCEFIAKGFGVQVKRATEIELSNDGVKNFVHVWCTKCRWLRMIRQQKIIALQSGGFIFTLYFCSREEHFVSNFKKEGLQENCCYCFVKHGLTATDTTV